jgi:hypothetical protein
MRSKSYFTAIGIPVDEYNGDHDQRASEVNVFHFVASTFREETEFAEGSGTSLAADLEFLYRDARKVQQIREDLGRVGPVIAEQVEEAMRGACRTQQVLAALVASCYGSHLVTVIDGIWVSATGPAMRK